MGTKIAKNGNLIYLPGVITSLVSEWGRDESRKTLLIRFCIAVQMLIHSALFLSGH
jgi:hypothetical protein